MKMKRINYILPFVLLAMPFLVALGMSMGLGAPNRAAYMMGIITYIISAVILFAWGWKRGDEYY
jgi:Kef-type K+ transport system membrane component KefB